MTATYTYEIRVVQGYSGYDHLAPISIDGTYRTLAEARKALRLGRAAQGNCARKSAQVRCDIVRSDGKTFAWQ